MRLLRVGTAGSGGCGIGVLPVWITIKQGPVVGSVLGHCCVADMMCAMQNIGSMPAHAAQAGGLLIGWQKVVEGVTMTFVSLIGAGLGTGRCHQPEVLVTQGITTGTEGPAALQNAVQPFLLQGRHAVPVDRMLQYDQIGLSQKRLLISDIDMKIRIVIVQIVDMYLRRRTRGIEQGTVGT